MREDRDLMEEFEFKPLSDGLGFHQRIQEAKKASVNMINPEVTPTLPRKEDRARAPASSNIDPFAKLNERKKLDFTEVVETKQKQPVTTALPWKATVMDPAAVFLDLMLISAGYLLCLIVLIATTRIDLFANLLQADAQGTILSSLASLGFFLIWLYLSVNRMFLGFTPGEWVFDTRLGTPEQFRTPGYSLKVIARTLITLATGIIFLPTISFLMNKDFLGNWLGLELVKKA